MAAYDGLMYPIELGTGGILSDAPQTRIPMSKLVRAENATLYNGVAEKDFGSRRWNETPLDAGIVSFKDFWPTDTIQRLFTMNRAGKVHRFADQYSSAEVLGAATTDPATLNTSQFLTMLEAGAEEQGRNKKLFLLTGYDPVQVISGDGTTRTTISGPAADWTGLNQPFGAVIHRGKVYAWGNRNDKHRVYVSSATNHEDFSSTPKSHSVYPGESEGLRCFFVYKRKLFALKYPRGVYILVDDDTNEANWYFTRLGNSFGSPSPHAFCEVIDDILVGTSFTSISSIKAREQFQDFQLGNLFNALGVKRFIASQSSPTGAPFQHAFYYETKQEVYFTFRSPTASSNDRMAKVSYLNPQAPELTWITKDQPNCLGPIRDQAGVDRPAYGADDGYVYSMDQQNRWVGGVSSGTAFRFEILTPHLDFGRMGDMDVSHLSKNFDQLEVLYEPCGKWPLYVDVFVDGRFIRTNQYLMDGDTDLDSSLKASGRESLLEDGRTHSKILPIEAQGRAIAFRCYNEGEGQNVRPVKLLVFFKIAGLNQGKK